ncbi:MAG: flagellar hook-basal body complex protein, partial [Nitrospirota bacterium]|nr:flagellar hook-basal body complex protein [Nitrospirota bacterium]
LTQIQDGFAAGSLSSVSIDKDGIVTGLFTNGQSRSLAQVRLARFNNDQGLSKVGNNVYVLSNDSGQPILGDPNSGGMGRVLSNSLELSNVDLAQQFIKMIEYQRGFQANSRSITTTDELLQELVNLIR